MLLETVIASCLYICRSDFRSSFAQAAFPCHSLRLPVRATSRAVCLKHSDEEAAIHLDAGAVEYSIGCSRLAGVMTVRGFSEKT